MQVKVCNISTEKAEAERWHTSDQPELHFEFLSQGIGGMKKKLMVKKCIDLVVGVLQFYVFLQNDRNGIIIGCCFNVR